MKDKYTIQNYVEDLRTAVALAATEAEILRKVRPLAQKLVVLGNFPNGYKAI